MGWSPTCTRNAAGASQLVLQGRPCVTLESTANSLFFADDGLTRWWSDRRLKRQHANPRSRYDCDPGRAFAIRPGIHLWTRT